MSRPSIGGSCALARPTVSRRRCGTSARPASAPSRHTARRCGHLRPRAPDGAEPLITEKGRPHARATVLNLIVTVVDAAAADRVVHTLMGLGVRHPSRALVIVP